MLAYLQNLDSLAGLAILAIIAFCDTIIGIGFFVFGEVAFLAAGAALAGEGMVLPALTVLFFAWVGDMTSFALGKQLGPRALTRFMTKRKNRLLYRRAKAALAKHGQAFVVLSRLLGPTAWITPFLAGALGMSVRSYAPACALGVLLGVGQFLVFGAIGLQALTHLLPHLAEHGVAIGLVAALALISAGLWRWSTKPLWPRTLIISTVVTSLFLASNFAYFFVIDSHQVPDGPYPTVSHACEITNGPLVTQAGHSSLHLPQPINVLLISPRNGSELMADLGWHQNLTYSRDAISFATYVDLLIQQTPPVSELYLNDHPADSAFQMAGTIKTREHIRWWTVGQNLHLGALSKTDEIAIKYYRHLPALLHDIDPMVDRARDRLAMQLTRNTNFDIVGIAAIAEPVAADTMSDYQTDGGILVLTDSGHALPSETYDCLRITPFL